MGQVVDGIGTDDGACTWSVIHHKGLTQRVLQALRHEAGIVVSGATCSERHDDLDRANWVALLGMPSQHGQQRSEAHADLEQQTNGFHTDVSYLFLKVINTVKHIKEENINNHSHVKQSP